MELAPIVYVSSADLPVVSPFLGTGTVDLASCHHGMDVHVTVERQHCALFGRPSIESTDQTRQLGWPVGKVTL